MMLTRHLIYIPVRAEVAVFGGQLSIGDTLYQLLRVAAILHKALHRDAYQLMFLCQFQQLLGTHHRAVLAHYLATESRLGQSGKAAEVNRSLRVTGSDQHAAVTCLQGEHVSGATEVYRL